MTYLIVTVFVLLRAIEPSSEEPIVNVTVIEGSTAVLPCSISHLSHQKIAWTDQWSTMLAYQTERIIDDDRISIHQPYPTQWNLQIQGVKYGDQGIYTCQVNTNPMKEQTVVLNVIVPPRIIGTYTPSHIVTKEGRSVSLICNVTGIPRPTVTWYRKPSSEGQDKERIGFKGEELVIHNVTRYCGGIYECLADNNVPPAVKKEIRVDVEFQPEIRLPTKRIGQSKGRETILECVVTAFPHAVSVWQFRGRELSNSWKYRIEVFEEGMYTKTLSLRIVQLDERDYGIYMCVASNSLGKITDTMELYELKIATKPTTVTSTTVSVTPGQLNRGEGRGHKALQSDTRVDSPLLTNTPSDGIYGEEDEDEIGLGQLDQRIKTYIHSAGANGKQAAVDSLNSASSIYLSSITCVVFLLPYIIH
ncbi:opioid-binding protein/cell adhesion molecule homolog isoform X2 [Patella vulgata]|uniref:opioid-binding protein/cell adhesion molecule homolog isoform X2 n=1 Tax=Patella vulgata TaxID=6465 RepID=UPI00217F6041|nr:opioid-binding protein/cell adhesion molecule homolog isoform X2 [Patella vulgata]